MKTAKRITILLFICSIAVWFYGKKQAWNNDVTPPVIHSEIDELHIDASGEDHDLTQGLTAYDNIDGDVTQEIIVGTISPFTEKGVSKIEYIVFDSSNNVARYERTVYFDNYESPKLALSKSLTYEVNEQITISDRLTATDILEGDISDKIRFSSTNLTTYEEGTYKLKIEVKNSYRDTVKYQVPINIVPYGCDKEYIKLSEYLIYTKVNEDINAAAFIKEITNRKGDNMSYDQISITSEVDLTVPGTGQIRYELYDGNEVFYVTYLTVIVIE